VFEIDNQAPGGSQVSKHPTLLEHIEILIKVEKIDKGIQLKLSQCKLKLLQKSFLIECYDLMLKTAKNKISILTRGHDPRGHCCPLQ